MFAVCRVWKLTLHVIIFIITVVFWVFLSFYLRVLFPSHFFSDMDGWVLCFFLFPSHFFSDMDGWVLCFFLFSVKIPFSELCIFTESFWSWALWRCDTEIAAKRSAADFSHFSCSSNLTKQKTISLNASKCSLVAVKNQQFGSPLKPHLWKAVILHDFLILTAQHWTNVFVQRVELCKSKIVFNEKFSIHLAIIKF